jgi:hypothetical protein
MKFRSILILLTILFFSNIKSQVTDHGDVIYRARNVHAGNLIRLTFYNFGMVGIQSGDQSSVFTGEWPINSGIVQLGNASAFVMSDMRLKSGVDSVGKDKFESITPAIYCQGWDPNLFSHDSIGTFLGFEPLPGYLNLSNKEKDPQHAVAMSHQAYTWPSSWPDKEEDVVDPGWSNHWNGYFGKDQKNADEESFFVMDDYNYKKRIKGISLPLPLQSEPNRGGLGLKMVVRGLQWSNPDAEDCLFWLYDIKNIGELNLIKTVFGANVGASMGGKLNTGIGSEYADDASRFYREKGLAVNYDNDNIGVGGYTPVPWLGFAFLESPGNPFDGIDNDGDASDLSKPGDHTGKLITVDDFAKVYNVNDDIVLINYENGDFTRTVTKMPAEGISFKYNNVTYTKKPKSLLLEIPDNGIDDNLNGLIDESDGVTLADSSQYYLYIRSQYNNQDYLAKDYITGNGLTNVLIDERRDDGIDNDGDWDSRIDDVGLDGKPGTGDYGEGDGLPTSGWQKPGVVPGAVGPVNEFGLVDTQLPGESNVDMTDVDESDQIGLTSFKYYKYASLTYSNDDQMWDYARPGYFDNKTTEVADYDYVFSSGYFPLNASEHQFFSVCTIYGWDETDILRNKEIVQKIYNTNYNFAIAPNKPTLKAVAGDKIVTLYWDDKAEESFDRYLRVYDFEGYKIYKATDPSFEDAGSITDGLGYERYKIPLKIYDKVDGIYGYFSKDFGTGIKFNLGNESGLVHSFVDNNVINGVKYYYAVTAFDKGDAEKNISPTECTMFASVDQSGNIQLSENVVAAVPQAPSSGYEAEYDVTPALLGEALSSGYMGVNILNPDTLVDGDEYEIQFLDQSMDGIDNNSNGLIDGRDKSELLPTVTTGVVLKNLTQNIKFDTVWFKESRTVSDSTFLLKDIYDDGDGNSRTFTFLKNGMEIHGFNPPAGVIDNPSLGINNGIRMSKSFGDSSGYILQFQEFQQVGFKNGTTFPRQLKIVFDDNIVDTSDAIGIPLASTNSVIKLPRVPVNFRAYDLLSGNRLRFGIADNTVDPKLVSKGHFSAKDKIVFYEKLVNDSTLITFHLFNAALSDTNFIKLHGRIVGTGDTLYLYPDFPFNGNTRFQYKVRGQKINTTTAVNELNRIKVVPNPYVVTALWEPRNPYSSGHGPRAVQFIHLPEKCTIRIFTVDGTLVRTLEHEGNMRDGSETWDLLSKDNMDVAYGIYIYHIDAPGLGEHIGRMLIIK